MRRLLSAIVLAAAATSLSACGSEGISVPSDSPDYPGAVLFAARCSGCHTLTPAGTQGSQERELRVQGPNLDQRYEKYDDALYAIRNGGFSGAIMPQNIVTGEEANQVAQFVAKYSGSEVTGTPTP